MTRITPGFIKPHIKLLTDSIMLDKEMSKLNAPVLKKYLDVHITNLEYKLRYAGPEEIKTLQGALRALDDIRDLLEPS